METQTPTPTTDQLEKAMKISKQIKSLEKQKLTAARIYNEKLAELQQQIDALAEAMKQIMNPEAKTAEA